MAMTSESEYFESSGKAVSTLPLWRRLGLITGLVIGLFYSTRIVTQPVPLNAASAESAVGACTTFYRNIEDIQPGDLVLSRDEHGTQIAPRPVRETYRRTSHHLRQLTFRDNAGREQTLQTTYEHPFWSVSDNAFVDAGKLQPGKTVTSPDGQIQTLVATRREDRPEGVQVFNFQVDGFHTYYVHSLPDTQPILVHNAECNWTATAYVDGTTMSPIMRPGVHNSTEQIRASLANITNRNIGVGTVSQTMEDARRLAIQMAGEEGVLNPVLRLDNPGRGMWPHFHVENLLSRENLHFWFPQMP